MYIDENAWLDAPLKLGIMPGKRSDINDIVYWKSIYELQTVPRICSENKYHLAALKLIYSGIDNLGWLTRPHERLLNNRNDFMLFADNYLLPGSGLDLTSIDLYGARCGLLHSNISESNLSQSKKARKINYKNEELSEEEDKEHLNLNNPDIVLISTLDLLNAYDMSIDKLNLEISRDTDFSEFIYSRSNLLFTYID